MSLPPPPQQPGDGEEQPGEQQDVRPDDQPATGAGEVADEAPTEPVRRSDDDLWAEQAGAPQQDTPGPQAPQGYGPVPTYGAPPAPTYGAAQPGYGGPGYGYPPQGYGQPSFAPAPNGKATAALITGIATLLMSWCCGAGILGVIAIVLGARARNEIRASGGRQTGDGLAIGGMVTGAVAIVVGVLALVLIVVALARIGSDFPASTSASASAAGPLG